ncbi:hypothetical protein VMCG_00351 [Cytospora schulzeri]|uniref:C6 zinc finger domain protein n=1 Tax=Cytospora schulzeri TaxID=448051 RepID=A0A423X9I9_9PEZI|nr:hypothetical protein VMCG_00351 [Valsa malicola]
MALNKLTSTATDENIVLLVCLLFICIEMLQGNKDVAIQHCRHGITICNNTSKGLLGWAKEALRPIFLRLATFPYFFGVEVADFPEPVGLVSDALAMGVTAEEKATAWDYLVNRAVRLVRLGLSYRQGPLQHLSMPDYLHGEKERIYESLVAWQHHYRTVRGAYSPGHKGLDSHLYDEMKCIVGKIWIGCCLHTDEMVYDEHITDFEEIIHLSDQLMHLRATESGPRPKFIFEMGFMPFLYFTVIKCRRLDLRLTALRQMPLISHEQENLFSAKILYFVGKRCIEVEHGIHLDPYQTEYAGATEAPMPPDEVRIRTVDISDETEIRKDENGLETSLRKVFIVLKPGADVPGFSEWASIGPYPGTTPKY